MPPVRHPKVGDLVMLDELAREELVHLYHGDASATGLVMRCYGVRCEVIWSNGTTSTPMRTVLDVVNESR